MKKDITLLLLVVACTSLATAMSPDQRVQQIILDQKERISVPGFIPHIPVFTPEQRRLDNLKFRFVMGKTLQPEEITEIKNSADGSLGGLLALKKSIDNQPLNATEESEIKKWQEKIAMNYENTLFIWLEKNRLD